MKFLIDTNIFIKAEPTSPADIEPMIERVADLLRLISEEGSQIYVHPDSLHDIDNDKLPDRRHLRKALFNKYPRLQNPPKYKALVNEEIIQARNKNDKVDIEILASLLGNAVDFLISEDIGIHKKGARLGLSERIATIACAFDIVKLLLSAAPIPPPLVESVFAYELNQNDPIFLSFRKDYDDFDSWLEKCKREHRQAWIIRGDQDEYAGLCIIKSDKEKRLKICSFKILEKYQGNKFGELLLKTVFDYCFKMGINESYLTVYEKYGLLLQLFEDFGFKCIGVRNRTNELVLSKKFAVEGTDYTNLEPLRFNVQFGPQAIKLHNGLIFVVPIQPDYYSLLFPEYEQQIPLIPNQASYGNSIKKVYVCNSNIRKIKPGSTLLFYQAQPYSEVCAIGVTESTIVSSEIDEIMRFAAKRTVFSYERIQDLCKKQCLGILFRQAFRLDVPMSLADLKKEAILKSAPQQIMSLPKTGLEWIKTRISGRCF